MHDTNSPMFSYDIILNTQFIRLYSCIVAYCDDFRDNLIMLISMHDLCKVVWFHGFALMRRSIGLIDFTGIEFVSPDTSQPVTSSQKVHVALYNMYVCVSEPSNGL